MASASSSFAGSENPLSEGGAWTSGPGAAGDVQKVSGFVRPATTGVNAFARYEAVAFAGDHESEVILQALNSSVFYGPCVRIQSASDPACYLAFNIGTGSIHVQRVDSSLNFSDLQSVTGLSLTAGTVVKLKVAGAVLELFIDGVSQFTVTDFTLTGGQPGLTVFSDTGHGGDDLIESWSATDGIGGDISDQADPSATVTTGQAANGNIVVSAGAAATVTTGQAANVSLSSPAAPAATATTGQPATTAISSPAAAAATTAAGQNAVAAINVPAGAAATVTVGQPANGFLGFGVTAGPSATVTTGQPANIAIRVLAGAASTVTAGQLANGVLGVPSTSRDLVATVTVKVGRTATITVKGRRSATIKETL